MGIRLLLPGALLVGLAGGFGWSWLASPSTPAAARAHKQSFARDLIPASPEEQPGPEDSEWTERADDSRAISSAIPVKRQRQAAAAGVHYPGCNAVRAAGKAPLHAGEPGYRADMDGDGDGIACEPRPGI